MFYCPVVVMNNINQVKFASGIGKYYTNNPATKNPKGLLTIGFGGIKNLIDKPQVVDKSQAQWLIPSTYPSRMLEDQEAHGEYGLLWADFDDKCTPPLNEVEKVIIEFIHDGYTACDYELYSSKSAKPNHHKARLLIPLETLLNCSDWKICQSILRDKLEDKGIKSDPTAEGAAQLLYLPNRGEHYETLSSRNDLFFNPVEAWAKEIQAKRDELIQQEEELKVLHEKSIERKASLSLSTTPNLIEAFNASFTPQELMVAAGYAQWGNCFRHPNSESGNYSASVKPDIHGVLRVHTLSSSDPLYVEGSKSGHDAFSVFTVLNHGGDKNAATKNAGDNLLTIGNEPFNKVVRREYMQNQAAEKTPPIPSQAQVNLTNENIDYSTMPDYGDPEPITTNTSTFNKTLDTEKKYCQVDLLQYIDDNHVLKALSIQTAAETHLPVNTVFLAGLSVFSSMVARKYVVNYQNGEPLPIGIYSVLEQPSGTGKSWCLGIFQKPFYAIQKRLLKDAAQAINNLNKAEELTPEQVEEKTQLEEKINYLNKGLFVTNSTPEALEKTLSDTQGFFSAISSEQGLFNSLLGNSYKSEGSSNNNDVMLNGFDGGHVNSIRITRKGFNGNVVGGVCCFAQAGSIENVLKASNGTGVSERFLMLAEPHSLGKRDHTRKIFNDQQTAINYATACEIVSSVIDTPITMDNLNRLSISDAGFLRINQYRNRIEPYLADGGRYSHTSLRGAASKINMQIMKIAANLHLMDKGDYNPSIDEKHIDAAIHIANELLEANLKLCKDKGIMGVKAEFTAILSLFEKDQRPRTERIIIQSKSQKTPFKDFSGNKSNLIRETLQEMVKQGLLITTLSGGKVSYAPT